MPTAGLLWELKGLTLVKLLEQCLAPDDTHLGAGYDYRSQAPWRLLVLLILTSPTCPSPSRHKDTVSLCPSPALTKLLLGLLALSRLSVLDLVVALAPHADEAAISKLYSTIRPYLEVSPGAGSPMQPHLGEEWVPWQGGACLLVFIPCCCPRSGLHLLSHGVAALCPLCSLSC